MSFNKLMGEYATPGAKKGGRESDEVFGNSEKQD